MPLRLMRAKPELKRQNSFNRNLRIQDNPDLGDLLRTSCCGPPANTGGHRPFRDARVVLQLGQRFRRRLCARQVPGPSVSGIRRRGRVGVDGYAQRTTPRRAMLCVHRLQGPRECVFLHGPHPAPSAPAAAAEPPVDREAIAALAQDYEFTLNDLGLAKETAKIAKTWRTFAHFTCSSPMRPVTYSSIGRARALRTHGSAGSGTGRHPRLSR